MRHNESQIQQACVRWFRLQHPRLALNLFAVPNGGARRRVEGAIMKAEGVTAGVADLLPLVPGGGHHGLCIEMKTPKGRQQPTQRLWQQAAENAGYKLELGLDCGLRDGLDAAAMARRLQQYLQHPDMLFRRVRDEHGTLQLSQRAAEFHPGRGVYRSSYKNARRLAVTETNMAYRTADHERWQQLDFIVGIEIHLSNNHTCRGRDGKPHPLYDICDKLAGKYPKDFKFTGWHPHCRCIATTILKTDEELEADDEAILRGEEPGDPGESENAVTELPDNFTRWVEENGDRIARAKSMPYFISDNVGVFLREQTSEVGGHKMGGHKMMGRAEEKQASQAYSEPKNNVQPVMSAEQIENRNQLADMVGILPSEIRPNMTHDEADGGYPNENNDKENCALTVIAYEARRRGLDVTALPFSPKDEESWVFKIGDDLGAAWINPSRAIPLKSLDGRLLQKSIDDATRAVGRYHLEWDKKTPQIYEGKNKEVGHIIVAERLNDGTLVMHCPQTNEYYGLGSFEDAKDGTFKIRRVDKLSFNLEVVSQLLRRR